MQEHAWFFPLGRTATTTVPRPILLADIGTPATRGLTCAEVNDTAGESRSAPCIAVPLPKSLDVRTIDLFVWMEVEYHVQDRRPAFVG